MTKRLLGAALLLALAVPLHADFNDIARAIDDHRGVKKMWMPGIGVARFLVWVVRPKGVRDFQIAVFEGATDTLDPHELQALMRAKVGPGFAPLVQVRSKKSREWTFIYARPRPNSDRIELVVLTQDNSDTVLVRVDVNADSIARELHEPRNVRRAAMSR
jgi:hypothetical protein